MKRFVSFAGLPVVLIVVGIVVAGLVMPAEFVIERLKQLPYPSYKIDRQIMFLDRWEQWWPWNSIRQTTSFTIPGEKANVGAKIAWSGRPASGEATVVEQMVWHLLYDVKLEGFEESDRLKFAFENNDRGTLVTIRFEGHFEQPVLGPYLALVADSMHGGMLDWALHNIEDLAKEEQAVIIE